MKKITVLRVEKNQKGFKVWIIKRCDENKSCVGQPTMFGVPANADACPIGTEFRMEFIVPDERPSSDKEQ